MKVITKQKPAWKICSSENLTLSTSPPIIVSDSAELKFKGFLKMSLIFKTESSEMFTLWSP